jgi:Emfourin
VLVTIVRAGGLAAFVRRTELDSAELPSDAAATLRALVDALEQAALPPPPGPDELRYELTVDEELIVQATEQTLSESSRRVIGFVDSRPERTDAVEPL